MAKGKSNLPVAWEAEMAARAKVAAGVNIPMALGKSITLRSGILAVDGEPVEGNELRVVVLADIYENQYYKSDFDPNTPTSPHCFAYSDPAATDGKQAVADMIPHADAEERQGRPSDQDQNTEYEAVGDDDGQVACRNCWANIMGTAEKGRGKACKNIRRLILVTEDALSSPQDLLDAETRTLKVPVMSTNNWSLYVNRLADDMDRPPEAVVTIIKVVPDPKSQFKVQFEFAELVNFDQDLYDALKKKIKQVTPILLQPYPKPSELAAQQASQQPRGPRPGRGAPPPRPGARPPAGKPAAKAPATAGAKSRKF
jgi:hypothetical protein